MPSHPAIVQDVELNQYPRSVPECCNRKSKEVEMVIPTLTSFNRGNTDVENKKDQTPQ